MDKISLKIGTFITILVMVSSIVGSYYTAIASSKDYTDEKIETVEESIRKEQKEIKEKVNETQIDIAVIKEILVNKYGKPNTEK